MAFDDDRDIAKVAAEKTRAEDRDDLQHEIGGQDTGRNPRFLAVHGNEDDGKSGKRGKRARADMDAFYLALMNDGAFGGFVAEEVLGGKSDAEISDIISEIEANTGQSFTDYASSILDPDAVERRPEESDADYNRRIVIALAEEMIDPVTGKIKSQYADDPMAQIILRDAIYRQIMEDVAHINLSGTGPDADAIVAMHREAGYESAELAGHHVDGDGHKGDLRDGQNQHADQKYHQASSVEANAGFFGSMDSTAQASEAGKQAFNNSAAKPADLSPSDGIKITPLVRNLSG